MNLLAGRRNRRRALKAYLAINVNPRADEARETLRHSGDPAERYHALGALVDRELGLYRIHDAAFGYQPWDDDAAGDAATGLAYGVMTLRLLQAVEWVRAALADGVSADGWSAHWAATLWDRADLSGVEEALAVACAPLLDRLTTETDPTEIAALYTRLWIAAYPVIGGQAAEWIAVLGNDWQCRAAGVQDGPGTVLILPNDRRGAVQYLPASDIPLAGSTWT